MFFVFGNGIPLPVSFALLVLPYVIPYLQGGGLSAEDVGFYARALAEHGSRRTREVLWEGEPVAGALEAVLFVAVVAAAASLFGAVVGRGLRPLLRGRRRTRT